jgi:hypothetical protein
VTNSKAWKELFIILHGINKEGGREKFYVEKKPMNGK